MQVREIMTPNPYCCHCGHVFGRGRARQWSSTTAARFPSFAAARTRLVVGVVTDRDIVCRLVAQGKNPVDESGRVVHVHAGNVSA